MVKLQQTHLIISTSQHRQSQFILKLITNDNFRLDFCSTQVSLGDFGSLCDDSRNVTSNINKCGLDFECISKLQLPKNFVLFNSP
jgi:hypothetical protein